MAAHLLTPELHPNRARIKTLCSRCGRLIHDGPEAPGGGVSHGLCAPHLNEWRVSGGLPPLTDEELRAFGLLPAEEAA